MKYLVILLILLFILNTCTYIVFYLDYKKRRLNMDRYPDELLFIMALAGGSLGAFLAMHILETKIHNPNFYMGVPIIMLAHTVMLIVFMTFIL